MVRGISITLKHTLGYFATAAVSAVELFPIFWKAVIILERTFALAVVGATGEGAPQNRKLYLMHEGVQGMQKEVLFTAQKTCSTLKGIITLW